MTLRATDQTQYRSVSRGGPEAGAPPHGRASRRTAPRKGSNHQVCQISFVLHLHLVNRCSVWKPKCPYPVQDAVLALCDGTSVVDNDLLTVDHIRRNDNSSQTAMLVYRPGFRWHYLSNQREHECFLIKIFDSLEGVQAKCRSGWEILIVFMGLTSSRLPAHLVQHRDIPSGCPPRESIEVRALVFTYAQGD